MESAPAAPLRVRVLGGLRIERDGRPVQGFVSIRARALLAFLAVTGTPHRREALAALLWGEWPEASARRSLRQVLFNLRQIVGPPLLVARDTVQLPHGALLDLDLPAFLALATADPREASPADLEAIVAAYPGDFLADIDLGDAPAFESWALAQREPLREIVTRALGTLGARALARRDWAAAIGAFGRLLAREPWHEDGHRNLMLALEASGQRDAAIAQFRACSRALAAELDVAPGAETVALYQRIVADGAAPPPALRARPTPPPTPVAALVGREAERECLVATLAERGCRLMTLLGPGGVGKTRLALAVAGEGRDAEAVCFVDLSEVAAADLVAPTIAEALALAQNAAQPLLTLLGAALRDRPFLLVLDNCERIVEAAPLIAALLAACPALTILATSRIPFHIRGEQEFPVAPLALPAPGDAGDAAAIAAAPAVRLFVARARAVRPAFALTPANAATIAAICAGVDGLPLGIELAAAWLKYLPLETILDRLHDRLALRSNGPRDLPLRHQTLRAAIAWSDELLDPQRRRLFHQLGVFSGGASAGLIADLCGSAPEDGLFAGLVALIDQSLLTQADRYDSRAGVWESRFGMLATIREYALAQLAAAGDLDAVRRRHARIFARQAEEAARHLDGPGQLAALERLDAERDNLRAALDWTRRADADHEAILLGLRLVDALWPFWEIRGDLSEGRHWLDGALAMAARLPAGLGAHERARALLGAGVFARRQGDYPAAARHLAASLTAFARAEDGAGVIAARIAVGDLALATGRYDAAHADFTAAIAAAGAGGADADAVLALIGRAEVAVALANYVAAADDLHAALVLARLRGDARMSATVLHRLARVRRDRGDLAGARASAEESLALQRDLNDRWGLAYALNILGNVARDQGNLEEAKRVLAESLALQRQLGDRQGAAYTQHQLGIIARRQGDWVAAQALADEALGHFRDLGHRRGAAYTTLALAQLAAARGDAAALAYLGESLAQHHALGDKRGIAATLAEYVALLIPARPTIAARLHGTIATLREQSGITPIPGILAEEVRQRAALRAALTPEGYARAASDGAAWPLDDVVATVPDLAASRTPAGLKASAVAPRRA